MKIVLFLMISGLFGIFGRGACSNGSCSTFQVQAPVQKLEEPVQKLQEPTQKNYTANNQRRGRILRRFR